MSWFQLDAESIAERVRRAGFSARLPNLAASVRRGIVGFTIVSVAGFVPWAVFGHWFHRVAGEAGMYLACAVVFIGLSGLLMHRLILGPGSLARFYKLFSGAFAVYSVAWIVGWMTLRGHAGGLAGLFAGTLAMGWIFVHAFAARGAFVKVATALFVLNALGYFVGGWIEGGVMGLKTISILGATVPKKTQLQTAMLLWGVCYGLGFGAGLGLAFHFCQERAWQLITAIGRD